MRTRPIHHLGLLRKFPDGSQQWKCQQCNLLLILTRGTADSPPRRIIQDVGDVNAGHILDDRLSFLSDGWQTVELRYGHIAAAALAKAIEALLREVTERLGALQQLDTGALTRSLHLPQPPMAPTSAAPLHDPAPETLAPWLRYLESVGLSAPAATEGNTTE